MTTEITTTTVPDPIKVVVTDTASDIALSVKALALLKAKDYAGLVKLGETSAPLLEQQIKDAEAVVPVIKEGYKTTEFWFVVAFALFDVYCDFRGIKIPPTTEITLGAAISAYAAGRHLLKINTPTIPSPTTSTAVNTTVKTK